MKFSLNINIYHTGNHIASQLQTTERCWTFLLGIKLNTCYYLLNCFYKRSLYVCASYIVWSFEWTLLETGVFTVLNSYMLQDQMLLQSVSIWISLLEATNTKEVFAKPRYYKIYTIYFTSIQSIFCIHTLQSYTHLYIIYMSIVKTVYIVYSRFYQFASLYIHNIHNIHVYSQNCIYWIFSLLSTC
jgi:hypothetical protein